MYYKQRFESEKEEVMVTMFSVYDDTQKSSQRVGPDSDMDSSLGQLIFALCVSVFVHLFQRQRRIFYHLIHMSTVNTHPNVLIISESMCHHH